MHELSVTQSILSIALEQAEKAKASKIAKINLTVGELSGIVEECVQFYFELLSKDTIAAEARLSFNRPAMQLRCRNCSTTFSPREHEWACPSCREEKAEIVSGREFLIDSIEVE